MEYNDTNMCIFECETHEGAIFYKLGTSNHPNKRSKQIQREVDLESCNCIYDQFLYNALKIKSSINLSVGYRGYSVPGFSTPQILDIRPEILIECIESCIELQHEELEDPWDMRIENIVKRILEKYTS